MAGGHGGARTPANPAPVSGPGALSARTDGGPSATQAPMVAPGGPYGSRQAMEQLQQSAPLAGGGGAEVTPPSRLTPADLPPWAGPTANPAEPVTAGADSGPGIGAKQAGIRSPLENSIRQMMPMLHSLEMVANLPDSTDATRQLVTAIKAQAEAQAAQPTVGGAR